MGVQCWEANVYGVVIVIHIELYTYWNKYLYFLVMSLPSVIILVGTPCIISNVRQKYFNACVGIKHSMRLNKWSVL